MIFVYLFLMNSLTFPSFSRSRLSVRHGRTTSPVYSIIICPSTKSTNVNKPQPCIGDEPTSKTRSEK